MKKVWITFVALVCLTMAMPLHAQLRLGVKGGVNLSKLGGLSGSTFKSDNRTGFFIGPMAEATIPILGLGIDAAALYSQSEAAITNGDDAKLKSFEIPVNLKWTIGLGSMFGVYIATGPQFGFQVGDRTIRGDFTDIDLKKKTTSYNLGAGLKLFRHLQLGVNYNFPLSRTGEIRIHEGVDPIPYKIKNKTWQISAAYMF